MTSTSFAERHGSIWLDGAFVSWPTANTHVLTHALHYGSAVFEGARVYGGRIFKLDEHTNRLARESSPLRLCTKDTLGYFVRTCWAGVNRAGGTHSVTSLEEQVTAD